MDVLNYIDDNFYFKENLYMTKSELREMIRECLREELANKSLTESPKKSYHAFMKVQDFIENLEGWEIIDCQQDDEFSMTLKCDVDYDIEENVEAIEDFSRSVGVDASVNWSDHRGYDVIIYLSYEG